MFDVKCKAEIRNLNVRVENHGDEHVPAIDVKMMLLGLPVDRITSLCPDIGRRFYDNDVVAVGEVNPLTVQHPIKNLRVDLDGVKINGCDVKRGAQIHLQPGKLANVLITVQTEHHNNLAIEVMQRLKSEVDVSVNERQLDVVDSQAG